MAVGFSCTHRIRIHLFIWHFELFETVCTTETSHFLFWWTLQLDVFIVDAAHWTKTEKKVERVNECAFAVCCPRKNVMNRIASTHFDIFCVKRKRNASSTHQIGFDWKNGRRPIFIKCTIERFGYPHHHFASKMLNASVLAAAKHKKRLTKTHLENTQMSTDCSQHTEFRSVLKQLRGRRQIILKSENVFCSKIWLSVLAKR